MSKVLWLGWVKGTAEDIPKLRKFGFTGEMKVETYTYHPTSSIPDWEVTDIYISHVNATTEVMERACKEWPHFNWRSFTGIDEDGNQLPLGEQHYLNKPYPSEATQ